MTFTFDEKVESALRLVIDPELNLNIVDLGLVYGVEVDGAKVKVTMTMTTPGCPMHEAIAEGVRNVLAQLDGVSEVDVAVVWEPPWNPDMLTADGRAQLGFS